MRKRNKIIILGTIFILIFSFIYWDPSSEAKEEEEKFVSIFSMSNADIEEILLSGWTITNEHFAREQDINSKMDEIVKALGAEREHCKRKIEVYENMSKGILNINKKEAEYCIILESFMNDDMDEKTYCTIKIMYNNEADFDVFNEKQGIERTLKTIDLPVKLYASVAASYKGKMDETMMQSTIDMILNTAEGHVVEKLSSSDLTSISVYTDSINDFIVSNGKKVNMQIAMRYSPYYDKTYIWIGSPLIPYEY